MEVIYKDSYILSLLRNTSFIILAYLEKMSNAKCVAAKSSMIFDILRYIPQR